MSGRRCNFEIPIKKDDKSFFYYLYRRDFRNFYFLLLFDKEAVFGITYFLQIALISVLGDLPLLIFYSKKELTRAQMKIRYVLHFGLIEAVLLLAGKWMGLYGNSLVQTGVFFAIVAFVYWLVFVFGYMMNSATAGAINKRIEERRKGK